MVRVGFATVEKRSQILTRLAVHASVHVAAYPCAQKLAQLKTVAGLRQLVHVQLRVAKSRVVAVAHVVGCLLAAVAIAGGNGRRADRKCCAE